MTSVHAASTLTPWVQYARPRPDADTVLLCFPHAGGAASGYRGWITALGDHRIEVWPVQLPGREGRFAEPALTDPAELSAALDALFDAHLADRPYALYGHSAGAVLACAFARHRAVRGRPGPQHVFVGACRPPSRPDPDFPIHRLDRAAFLARLFAYGRLPAEALDFPDLIETTIATARADLRLAETYRWPDDVVLDCPVTAVGGVADGAVPIELLPHWSAVTRGSFSTVVLSGGHFPAPAAEQRLLEVIRRALR